MNVNGFVGRRLCSARSDFVAAYTNETRVNYVFGCYSNVRRDEGITT